MYRTRRPKAISLFAGCGGSDIGLLRAGFEIVWANEISEVASATYRDNLPGAHVEVGDVSTFAEFPEADLLVGCYPCQGYSQAGRRTQDAPVNFLYREFDRVLRTVRPRAFVVENVSGMSNASNRRLLNNQLVRYRLAGYRVKWRVLDAKNFGVPQTRRRLFMVGIRSDLRVDYSFPAPTHGPDAESVYLAQEAVLTGMPKWPVGEFCSERLHWYYLSRKRRADWGQPSPCIVAHWRHVPLHPMSPPLRRVHTDQWVFEHHGIARRLSFKECAALQGFPVDFVWAHGSVRRRFEMIGNAVPPPLFHAVVRALPPVWA